MATDTHQGDTPKDAPVSLLDKPAQDETSSKTTLRELLNDVRGRFKPEESDPLSKKK